MAEDNYLMQIGGAVQLDSRAISEVQGAIVVAKNFPRSEKAATDKILAACQRQSLAESAIYTYAKGGSNISGPSIRLAETIAQAWGNIQFGIREIDQVDGESTVEAFAWDVESNTRQVKTFKVRHVRHTKKGQYKISDPREIYEMVANQGARRLRACILGVIPGDVVEKAVEACEKTMLDKVSPEATKSLLDAFSSKFGVSVQQIEARIQRKIEAITPPQVADMRKIYTSLRDGMSSVADWFPPLVQSEQNYKSPIDDLPKIQPVPPIDLASQAKTAASNPEMVKKYQEVIDKMTSAEQIDKWRAGIQAALERDLPNEEDQMLVYSYAEDAYQTLKG